MVKKELHTPSEVLGANSKTASWQSCAATTDAAPEAVCSQVSSSPTAMAAQVMTAASNTTLASDTRELTEVETWSLGDARRIRVIDAPRVNFDLNVQTASPCTSIQNEAAPPLVQNLPSTLPAEETASSETVQIGTRLLKPCTRVRAATAMESPASEPLQFVGACQVQLPLAMQNAVKADHDKRTVVVRTASPLPQAAVVEQKVVLEDHLFCPHCGNCYLPDSAFCRHCGRKRDQVASSAQEAVARPRGGSVQANAQAVRQPAQPEAPRVTPSPPRTMSPPPSRSPIAWQPQPHLQPLSQVLAGAQATLPPFRQSSCTRPKEDTVYVTATSCMNAASKERSWK